MFWTYFTAHDIEWIVIILRTLHHRCRSCIIVAFVSLFSEVNGWRGLFPRGPFQWREQTQKRTRNRKWCRKSKERTMWETRVVACLLAYSRFPHTSGRASSLLFNPHFPLSLNRFSPPPTPSSISFSPLVTHAPVVSVYKCSRPRPRALASRPMLEWARFTSYAAGLVRPHGFRTVVYQRIALFAYENGCAMTTYMSYLVL